jgi:stearoyl-CoA desaturase (delta-9 desaturase)
MAFVFPTLVAGLFWGDWVGGYFFAGAMRLCFVHHSTFCVNSVAHYIGEQNFDDHRSPRDSWVTALLTLGEGYHNFHHEFPNGNAIGLDGWMVLTLLVWVLFCFLMSASRVSPLCSCPSRLS